MRRFVIFAAVAGCMLVSSPSFAAGWSFTADTPVSYTFDNSSIVKLPSPNGSNVTLKSRETTEVSGSKVLLIAPFHFGVGNEDYRVSQSFTSTAPVPGTANLHFNVQMVDVVLDFPMRLLNVTLGYGQGQANVDVEFPAPPQGPSSVRHADAQQTFVVVGIPLGQRFDVHVGYHWVAIQNKPVSFPSQNPPFDKIQLNGQMLSAGLRLNC